MLKKNAKIAWSLVWFIIWNVHICYEINCFFTFCTFDHYCALHLSCLGYSANAVHMSLADERTGRVRWPGIDATNSRGNARERVRERGDWRVDRDRDRDRGRVVAIAIDITGSSRGDDDTEYIHAANYDSAKIKFRSKNVSRCIHQAQIHLVRSTQNNVINNERFYVNMAKTST